MKDVSRQAALLCLLLTISVTAEAADLTIRLLKTPEGVHYGVWGSAAQQPVPTLIVLAGDIRGTLGKPYFRQCGNDLAKRGWICVSIDLPSHGSQVREGEPSGLSGWSHQAARKVDFVKANNERLASVVDHLIESGLSDAKNIAVCGTSRGGFLAIHFAAFDPRIQCAAGFAPVTDLAALSEFRSTKDQPFVSQLGLVRQADKLAGRPVWIVIGDQDERVSTSDAIDFAASLTKAARDKQLDSRVELHVMPEPRGHTTPTGSAARAAEWILRQSDADVAKEPESDTSSRPAGSRASEEGTRHFLFVDDHHVLYRSGTQRVFHPAEAHASNPVIREEKPWEMAIGWTSVVRHAKSGKYQLWYQAYGGSRDLRKSHKCVVCYAESDDGITFTKPDLAIHNFKTDRKPFAGTHDETNIVLLGDGGYGDRYANSVLFEADEGNPARRYKMLYTDFGKDPEGREWPGVFAAFSPDGVHWTKSPRNPLLKTAYGGRGRQPPFSDEVPYDEAWDGRKNFLRKNWPIPLSMSDAIDVMFEPHRRGYVAYGKCWIQGPAGGLAWKHAMARVESDDFLNWSKPKIVAAPDDLDPPNTEFHTSPVFFRKGVYFCLNQILSARGEAIGAKADAMHIELMTSRDGLRWERPFREEKFIDSTSQAFSNGGIFTNATPVVLEDSIRFYYGGYNSGAIGGGSKLTDPSQQSGVGFATIPLDRFAGIRPVAVSAQSTLKRPLENIGQITLKPISFDNVKSLSLNADASEGSIRIELLDADGYRLRGFSKDDAMPLTTDSLQHTVRWKQSTLAELPKGKYMLRLHLDNAEVFALSLHGDK